MNYYKLSPFALMLLIACQNQQSIERSLVPEVRSNGAEISTNAGVAGIVSGNSFRSGSKFVTFADDGTYRYSWNGFSVYTKWSANADSLCLHYSPKSCSRFKQKGGNRYGWAFRRGNELSFTKVPDEPVKTVNPIQQTDKVLTSSEALLILGTRKHQLPNRLTVQLSSNKKITFIGRRTSSTATLSENNGKLCGNFRIGETSCLSIIQSGERHFLISERQNQNVTRRWILPRL